MNNKKIGDLNFSSNILNNIVDSIKNLNDNSYLPAVFLLIITISGNFLAETFSCSIRQLLENNYIAKNILLFFLIFFTSSINANSHESPLVKLRKAFIIYIFFIMFSKMNKQAGIWTFYQYFRFKRKPGIRQIFVKTKSCN